MKLPEPDSTASGGSRAKNASAQKHKTFDGLPKYAALDGSGLRRSRCHRFEALGEIYNLGRLPEPENIKKLRRIVKVQKREEIKKKCGFLKLSADHFGAIGATEFG